MPMSAQAEALFAKCVETFVAPPPCRTYNYLLARHAYHKQLLKEGLISPRDAEPHPGEKT